MLTSKQIDLPKIPMDLILTYDEILKLPVHPTVDRNGKIYEVDFYKVFVANDSLWEWVQETFTTEIENVEYLVAYKPLSIHRDMERTVAFNYVIDLGGSDIHTEFYNEDRTKLIYSIKYNQYEWHLLNVDLPHCVVGELTSPRIIISVTPTYGSIIKNPFKPK